MKKIFGLLMAVVLVLGFSGIASAISDPGTNYGPIDLTEATAEIYDRGDTTLLKISITCTPNLPGVVIFEADVDNSTGTGGSISTIGAPVSPCPCKTEPGFDIAVSLVTRAQANSWAGSCVGAPTGDPDPGGSCAKAREAGEWYAVRSAGGQPSRGLGVLRGYLDPHAFPPTVSNTSDAYTLPYSAIIAYANQEQRALTPGDAKNFNPVKARANGYTDGKWQISVFYDPNYDVDEDDVATDGDPTTFDINDFAPDSGKADLIDSGGAANPAGLTYCEGNFDNDQDVDGGDAAKFKANFGRSPFKNPCPPAGPNY